MKLKKGDAVIVTAGKFKGLRGQVLAVLKQVNKIIVSGVTAKKTRRANPNKDIPGGIVEVPAPLDASNVAIFNEATGKKDKVRYGVVDGHKARFYKSTGAQVLDMRSSNNE